MNTSKFSKHAAEFARAYRNHTYEETASGLYFPIQHAYITTSAITRVNGKDPMVSHNKFTAQGRRYILGASLLGMSQSLSWYMAPFTGSVDVQDDWTAANFASVATEFVQYTEAMRPKWEAVMDLNASTVDNRAAPAQITLGTGVANQTIRGWGCLSVPNKGGTTGILLAALRNDRPSLNEGDVLSVQYTLVAQDAP